MITLQLTSKESRLLQAAIRAEIQKGSGTFLSSEDILALGDMLHVLKSKELV